MFLHMSLKPCFYGFATGDLKLAQAIIQNQELKQLNFKKHFIFSQWNGKLFKKNVMYCLVKIGIPGLWIMRIPKNESFKAP